MFKVGDIIRVMDDNDGYWIIIKKSWSDGHFLISKLKNKTYTRGIWDDNMINCNREIKLKKICLKLGIK